MAALLVALAVMAILMTVAMPVWRHEAQREKEAEAIWRGDQYARAIVQYKAKNGGNLPPSIDILVAGRYLRKKYKDPLTKDGEWIPVVGASNVPGANPNQGQRAGQPMVGGIRGVKSKSTETSIRTYRGATRYDMWQFDETTATNANTAGGRAGQPGGPGGRGPSPSGPGATRPGQPGGPGTSPTSPTTPGQGGFGRPGGGVFPSPIGGRGPGRGGRGL
jgi:type II secretory pathway pseudopilin PulG